MPKVSQLMGEVGVQRSEHCLFNSSSTSQSIRWYIEPQNTTVHITNSNAPDFALDGYQDGVDGQDVYLWSANSSNINQQWIEISRGNDYYSYQKVGTDFCIDGGISGATNGQNVYLWTCGEDNQHWLKVEQANSGYRLEKRNDSNYAIHSTVGGNAATVNLYNSSNIRLTWYITPID